MATLADAYQLLHDGKLALARAERQGIRVDVDYCEAESERLKNDINVLGSKLRGSPLGEIWGNQYGSSLNYDSSTQLAGVLKAMGKKGLGLTDKGNVKLDESALRGLDIPDIDLLLRWRKLMKVRGTYLAQFIREEVNGWIHTFFDLHTTMTYRSSSSKPNFQNIPARDEESKRICRRALYPRQGHQLVGADYSGLEVSISCCYHRDPTMIRYLKDPKSDMHADQADELFFVNRSEWGKEPIYKKLRYTAKNGFVFPEFYGDYHVQCARYMAVDWCGLPQRGRWKQGQGWELPNGAYLSDHFAEHGIRSLGDFTEHVKKIEEDFWGRRFPVYDQWRRSWWKRYCHRGFIEMSTGFVCSGLMSRNAVTNYAVQGSAFHCLLWSFIEVDRIQREEGWRSRLIGQIHDQLILDVHPDELSHVIDTVKRVSCVDLLKAWKWITVPLSVEVELAGVDESWSEMKELEV